MAHPQQRLSRRDQAQGMLQTLQQEPQGGERSGGLDMASLVAMLTHLYGISQQQAQMPGQMEHQDLQNQLTRFQLQNAPAEAQQHASLSQSQVDEAHARQAQAEFERSARNQTLPGELQNQEIQRQLAQYHLGQAPGEFAQQKALNEAKIGTESAQAGLLRKKTTEVEPPASLAFAPKEYQDFWFGHNDPAYGKFLEQQQVDQDTAQWPQLTQRFSHEPMDSTFRAQKEAHWGAPAIDYLAGLHPGVAEPIGGTMRPGQKIHAGIQFNGPAEHQRGLNARNQVANFLRDMFGMPTQPAEQYQK